MTIGLPILVFASIGAGASIMMWSIKKILWPRFHTNNPLDSLNAAHNQALYHWGGSRPFDVFSRPISQCEQVFHVEPLPDTISIFGKHSSLLIHAHDDTSIMDISILAKKKLPHQYHDQELESIKQTQIQKNNLLASYKKHSNILYFTFHDLAHGNLDNLLNQTYTWLKVDPGRQHDVIVSIHQRWRQGNQRIWDEYYGH